MASDNATDIFYYKSCQNRLNLDTWTLTFTGINLIVIVVNEFTSELCVKSRIFPVQTSVEVGERHTTQCCLDKILN